MKTRFAIVVFLAVVSLALISRGAVRVLNLSDANVTVGRSWGIDETASFPRGGRPLGPMSKIEIDLSEIVATDGQLALWLSGPDALELVSVRDGGTVGISPNYRVTFSSPPDSAQWNHAHAVYAFAAGFFTFAVFGVWRSFRRIFRDAD